MNETNIWFTSDLHFSHKNILRFQEGRRIDMGIDEISEEALTIHDEKLIEKWNNTIRKKDVVYILGDFSFAPREKTEKILRRLNGAKHLIIGNHDKSLRGLERYFKSVSQIKEVTFKKQEFDFLDEDICMILCHFPIVAWNKRLRGALMVHGHTHGSIDKLNLDSEELRVDVGYDSKLANGGFVNLRQLYLYFKCRIIGYDSFQDYINAKTVRDGVRY